MIKKIILTAIICLIGFGAFSQEGTTSPYSFYGIGTLKFRGTAENRMMAGISTYSDSIHLNIQNPAGLAGLRLTTLTAGTSFESETQKSDAGEVNTSTTSVDYVAVGIPMGKFGASFGLLPFTSVGYSITDEGESLNTLYSGSGGLNKAFLALAYQVTKDLSVGVDVSYNFGRIENTALVDSNDNSFEFATSERNESDLSGLSYNFGLAYKKLLDNGLEVSAGVTYTPGTNFNSRNFREIATVLVSSNTDEQLVVFSEEIAVEDTDFTFPSQLTVGGGLGKPKNWFVGLEVTDQKTSNFTNRTFEIDNVIFTDAIKYRVGGFYIPDYNAINSYVKRIVYRGGFRFEGTGINVNGEDINEFGISFGVGLPAGRLFSNINLGFELGSRGTLNQGLVQENFFNVFLGLSLNDRWFEKRYFD